MVDLDRIEAFYAPKRATEDDDPTDCPRCHVTVVVRDGEEWTPEEGDYCDHCEGVIGRAARTDVPALVAELRAARAEIERLRTAAADERADVVAWMRREVADPMLSGIAATMITSDLADCIARGAHVGAAKGRP